MGADLKLVFVGRQGFFQGFDHALIQRQPSGENHRGFRLQRGKQAGDPPGHRKQNPLDDVGGGDAPGNHVDHVGFRQHRANAGGLLRLIRLEGDIPHFFHRQPQVAGDVFDELSGSGGALAGHLVIEHPALRPQYNGLDVEGPDVHHRAGVGVEEMGAFGMGGHAVKMPPLAPHHLPFAGGSQISDLLIGKPVFLQQVVDDLVGHLRGIALADLFRVFIDQGGGIAVAQDDCLYAAAPHIHAQSEEVFIHFMPPPVFCAHRWGVVPPHFAGQTWPRPVLP